MNSPEIFRILEMVRRSTRTMAAGVAPAKAAGSSSAAFVGVRAYHLHASSTPPITAATKNQYFFSVISISAAGFRTGNASSCRFWTPREFPRPKRPRWAVLIQSQKESNQVRAKKRSANRRRPEPQAWTKKLLREE